ncbi:MAG TPA: arsenic resistance N-acetyltransferase ArsN2 [Roseiflexaceae bacterium]|nr:arsenic resistance N-acetyltransferase ArsN2 [Roseiflexaceae bacterium]
MTVTIARLHTAELPLLLALLERSGLPCDGVNDHLATAIVAHDQGEVVGSAALELYGASALLRSVAVDGRLQRRGLGRQLVQSALDIARQRGVEQVYLLTETAPDFFARLGFMLIERATVPPAVQQSVEFTSACPASAQAMALDLLSLSSKAT